MENKLNLHRGDIYIADLNPATGSEQSGVRPVLIIQNDVGNHFSPTTICCSITSRQKKNLPTHVAIQDKLSSTRGVTGSTVTTEQVRTISKERLQKKIGHLPEEFMEEIGKALSVSFGFN